MKTVQLIESPQKDELEFKNKMDWYDDTQEEVSFSPNERMPVNIQEINTRTNRKFFKRPN